MSVDTPATVAILGAGPIGLEAGLYARYLGYAVNIYERGAVCQNVLDWGHVRMFTPFGINRSPLGLAALAAQSDDFRPPEDEVCLTGREWVERYLLPLARTDLLAESVHERTRVISVSRYDWLKTESPGGEDRGDSQFCILLDDPNSGERFERADVVIDTTGVFGNPNWIGPGGNPAIGEIGWRSQIEYGLPDFKSLAGGRYAGRHTLLIGGGYSAATNAVALAHVAQDHPGTRVTWVTRRDDRSGPVTWVANDRLPERSTLAGAANAFAMGSARGPSTSPSATWFGGTWVEQIGRAADGSFSVKLGGKHAGEYRFDEIIANIGWRPDGSLYRELQVHMCYASEGPMRLAAMMRNSSSDCLDQEPGGPSTLLNPEPNFYILGAKSHGRNSNFLIVLGLLQIKELFSIIGDRENLDLYTSVRNPSR